RLVILCHALPRRPMLLPPLAPPSLPPCEQMGFFAEAGPVQIFVSNHLIPDDMSFTPGDINSYQTEDGTVKIQADSEVRLKIVGTRVDATEIAHRERCVKIVGTRVDATEIVSVRVIIDSDEMGAVEMGAAQMDAFGTVGTGV
ncbi:unnamed protein product, partial [Closterium sp. NIES-53]